MSKQTKIVESGAMPIVSLENPEVVRLRIAQENLTRLITMKCERINEIRGTVLRLCENAISYTYFTADWQGQSDQQKRREQELFAFIEALGIYIPTENERSKDNLASTVGKIRAGLTRWHQAQLEDIMTEIQSLLLKT